MRSLTLAASLLAVATVAAQTQQLPFSLPSTSQNRIAFASTSSSTCSPATFSGQRVVRFTTTSPQQHRSLIHEAQGSGLDIWAARLGAACEEGQEGGYGCVDIRLALNGHNEDSSVDSMRVGSEELIQRLLEPFEREGRPKVMTMIEDLGELVDSQRRPTVEGKRGDMAERVMKSQAWHKDYHTYEEITQYMNMLQQSYPTHAQVVEIGKTYEGRAILGLKLSNNLTSEAQPSSNAEQQPPSNRDPLADAPHNATCLTTAGKLGIVITAAQHAREWISTSTSLFFASDLLSAALGPPDPPFNTTHHLQDLITMKEKKNRKGKKGKKGEKHVQTWTKSSARAILSTFSITIIPISNPDGYVYSWTKNRMWRKNRQPNHFPSDLFCKGIDLNRNYDFAFSPTSPSSSPCSETYAGPSAFSSQEAKAIANYLESESNNIRGYFDLHSYGQLLMYPYSYDCKRAVPDEEDLLEMSLGAVAALRRVHRERFTTGKICSVYAPGGGNSVDWAYASTRKVDQGEQGAKNKIKWSFSVELRDGGTYGFLLPSEQILPASEEATAALAYMLAFIAKKDSRLSSTKPSV
ncbi:hypothetical protein NDA18_003929 [Ustilago nuda]|nr:hypothetical protein NDA18_003929 [Ustilago nuda]